MTMTQNITLELVDTLKEEIFQLKYIIKHIPGNLYWMDCNANYKGCNQNLSNTLGLTHPDEIIDRSMLEFWHDGVHEAHYLNMALMQKEESYEGEEHVIIDNQEHVFLSEKIILRNSKGKVSGLLGLSFDITHQKNIEKALQQAKEKAEMANQAKMDFIRNMEHDLRTPLCGMLGVASHLSLTEENADKKELLADIEKSIQAVLHYFDHIVEFSQLNQHMVPQVQQTFDLQQLIKAIILIESAAIRDKNIQLIFDYAQDAPTLMNADRFRIHRILLNLVNNAIKFTQKGHVKITVDLLEQQAKKLFKITVQDTGIGIAKKDQEIIFDKFTRCEPTNKNIYKGTGLGLWIVKEFIQDMGGTLQLNSELNQGSCFTIHLPFSL